MKEKVEMSILMELFIGLLLAVFAAFWIVQDGRYYGVPGHTGYAILALFILIIGLPLYLLVRNSYVREFRDNQRVRDLAALARMVPSERQSGDRIEPSMAPSEKQPCERIEPRL